MSTRKRQSSGQAPKVGGGKTRAAAVSSASDRRAIEGIMHRALPGGRGASAAVLDAQDVMYEAFDQDDPDRQIALALEALKISEDCADAYVLLADYADTLSERLELYEQGVAAGERALGKKGFRDYDGRFWGFLETRPYMRARQGLVDCLWAAGRRDEAVEHCQAMLRLNPNDNQGMRYRLASMLLDLERHDELASLLEQYEKDGSAEWAFARALLAYRREGDTATARRLLAEADEVNPHVAAFLTGAKMPPRDMPEYITLGGEDDAAGCAVQYLPAWKQTPGAMAWLRTTLGVAAGPERGAASETWSAMRRELAQLPSVDETWEIDLRSIGDADGSGGQAVWAVVACGPSSPIPRCFEFFDERPRDAEAWQIAIDAMRDPDVGEACRPAAVCVARKAWQRSWRTKLQQIDVECVLGDQLDLVDSWVAESGAHVDAAQRLLGGATAEDADWSQAEALPQRKGAVWQAVVRRLPVWVSFGGEPVRPWIWLIVDERSEAILGMEIAPEQPADEWLLWGVLRTMTRPAIGEPHRPAAINVATDHDRELLAPQLQRVGVDCVVKKKLSILDRVIGEVSDQVGGNRQVKSLVEAPGMTLQLAGDYFAAAADFYRRRPWRHIPGDTIIRVACDRFKGGPWYAVVMGQSGIEFGLALYDELDVVQDLLSGELSEESGRMRTSALTLMYGEAFEMSPHDVDAAEERGWPVASPEAYPAVMRVKPRLVISAPKKSELELLTGCLRAIPDFLDQRAARAQAPATICGEEAIFSLERFDDGD